MSVKQSADGGALRATANAAFWELAVAVSYVSDGPRMTQRRSACTGLLPASVDQLRGCYDLRGISSVHVSDGNEARCCALNVSSAAVASFFLEHCQNVQCCSYARQCRR